MTILVPPCCDHVAHCHNRLRWRLLSETNGPGVMEYFIFQEFDGILALFRQDNEKKQNFFKDIHYLAGEKM